MRTLWPDCGGRCVKPGTREGTQRGPMKAGWRGPDRPEPLGSMTWFSKLVKNRGKVPPKVWPSLGLHGRRTPRKVSVIIKLCKGCLSWWQSNPSPASFLPRGSRLTLTQLPMPPAGSACHGQNGQNWSFVTGWQASSPRGACVPSHACRQVTQSETAVQHGAVEGRVAWVTAVQV